MLSAHTLAVLASSALFAQHAHAVTPVVRQGQDFVVQGTTTRFNIIGVDYQPGGQSGYKPGSGVDPLSNATACLRDAALMQSLGINTIRSYNVDPTIDHDECASIFNSVGIYMIFDVNSPLAGQSIDRSNPSGSYTSSYLSRAFSVVDAFRQYPNTLGFFGANELINDDPTGVTDPPYIRAVQRDLRNYMSARGGRQVPIGYSAADVREILVDTANYVSCNNNDNSESEFFGLNSYSWCGSSSNAQLSGYDVIASDFASSSIPVFFSEYGCNMPSPRVFDEVPYIYGGNMADISGGLVYEWTQEPDNFGLVQVNTDGSLTLLQDYVNLAGQYATLNRQALMSQNTTATSITAPACNANLISSSTFNSNFNLPAPPSGASSLIANGVGGRVGALVSVTATSVNIAVTSVGGAVSTGLTISTQPGSGRAATAASSSAKTTSARATSTGASAGTAASTAAAASASATHMAAGATTDASVVKAYTGLTLGSLLIWYLGA